MFILSMVVQHSEFYVMEISRMNYNKQMKELGS